MILVEDDNDDDKLHLLTRQSPMPRMTAPTHAATMMMITTDAAGTKYTT